MLAGCVGSGKRASSGPEDKAYTFSVPSAPSLLDENGRMAYLRDHFWDNFDFDDPSIPARVDSSALSSSFLNSMSLLIEDKEIGAERMADLMEKASSSEQMYSLFSSLTESFLHNPNSPFRDDILFLPVLDSRAGSQYLSEEERAKAAESAQLAARNNVGQQAEDFTYITIQGKPGSLYGLKAEYTLIFFNNPGCSMCADIRTAMKESKRISYMIESGRMKILGVYPDEDTALWESYRDEIPPTWINARDPGCVIYESQLYDLKAIPSLYLLDSGKKVILKDCTDVSVLESALASVL